MLKALVIYINERVKDLGDVLQIARATAKKIERSDENVNVRSILYDPVTGVYVALYESPRSSRTLKQGLEKGKEE